jgi:hypothetical protein
VRAGSRRLYWLLLSFGSSSALAAPALDGVWDVDRSLPAMGRTYSTPQFTAEGQRRHDVYDPFVDDPSLRCMPSGVGRVWDEPDTAFEIRQFDDHVTIRYEMFDLVRTIALNERGGPEAAAPSTENIHGQAMPTMGHSSARYEGDALVIETRGYAPGYVTTLVEFSGTLIPQSEAMRSTERIYRDGDRLAVEITYVDPVILTAPLHDTYRFRKSPFEMTEYGCSMDEEGNSNAPQ